MSKLESFDMKQTGWQGLWWHPEYNSYSSACINLSELKKFKGSVRLYVRKNKYYNGGENGRPNYTFCLKDAKGESVEQLDVTEARDVWTNIQRLAEVMRQGKLNGYQMALPSESAANAESLMKEAISLIEEITGEEWDFSFVTFG